MANKNNKKHLSQAGLEPSPFHKKGKNEGDHKRNWWGRNILGDHSRWGEDEWGIDKAAEDADKSFKDFQGLKDGAGENLWADAKNLIDIGDHFGGLENTMEDLTVNQQQAQFEKEMATQQNVNMMDAMMAGGGVSGAAANAQALSGIQSQQRRQLGGMLGQQESANQMAAAQQASANQMAQAKALQQADMAQDQGAMEAQKFQLQGKADARELQIQMQQAELSYLAGLKESAEANKDVDTAGKGSDRRLKKNINKIGESPSGLNIYSFEYKDSKHGKGLFQGVMSDEIPLEAVVDSGDWYDLVNYSMLDVEFKQI
tara:strand:- start:1477 stop:2421 length:945 start_codon:yes stop_codon:yes gene_type:complete